jgi:hypothetical protein
VFFVLLFAACFLVRKYYWACVLVSPLLTFYCFYYFAIVDFDGSIDASVSVTTLTISVLYFILAWSMESWLA